MFKVIFGFVGLVIVLAIVSSLAKTQLGAIGQATTRLVSPADTARAAPSGDVAGRAVGGARLDGFAATAGAEMPSAQQQIQGVQKSVFQRTDDALQQGVQRNKRADP